MTRGRKSQKVKILTNRDIDLLKQLARTGIANGQQAKEFCELSFERIGKLEKSGYIITSYHAVRGGNNLIIQLNKLGKEYCRQEFGIRSFGSAQTNHLEHDLKLTEIYYNLIPEIRETWRSEVELIKEIYDKFPKMKGCLKTCIDATIEIDGLKIAIESIGKSYREKDLKEKEVIAKKYLGCSKMESV